MDIFLYVGKYQSGSNEQYKSTEQYPIWVKQDGEKFLVKKQDDTTGASIRKYANFNELFNEWGLLFKDSRLIKKL